MRRYMIHADRRATWILVGSAGVCRWHIEKFVTGRPAEHITLAAFEASEVGQGLLAKLAAAINEAQEDA